MSQWKKIEKFVDNYRSSMVYYFFETQRICIAYILMISLIIFKICASQGSVATQLRCLMGYLTIYLTITLLQTFRKCVIKRTLKISQYWRKWTKLGGLILSVINVVYVLLLANKKCARSAVTY